jgi:hypothetical protein
MFTNDRRVGSASSIIELHTTVAHSQWAASNASWIAFEIRPREETSYPAAFAHSRIAWTWSRLDGTGVVLADVAALPPGPRLVGADFAAVLTGEAAGDKPRKLVPQSRCIGSGQIDLVVGPVEC